jgi:hypothetical protein
MLIGGRDARVCTFCTAGFLGAGFLTLINRGSRGAKFSLLAVDQRALPMALANAPDLRESELSGIVCSGLPSHANLLFLCANRAAVDIGKRL